MLAKGRGLRSLLPGVMSALLLFVLAGIPLPASAQGLGMGDATSGKQPQQQAQEAVPSQPESGEDELRPFGYNLFTGGFRKEQERGINPDYRISEGDQIALRIWGTVTINDILVVDPQGNVFIPNVGPVKVAGVRNADLNTVVNTAVRNIYTSNVNVYTSLNSSQPVAVFVTGFVLSPGRYTGIASNSILYFIDNAGGVDPQKGSYRDIRILRGGQEVHKADLYEFLLKGKIPILQFRDDDTIIVGPRGGAVGASGEIRNAYRFELSGSQITGRDLSDMARTSPAVSHVQVSGTRKSIPFSSYLTFEEFTRVDLFDGDQVVFAADEKTDMITIRVDGAHLGPSQYVVPNNTTLGEMLDHVPVNKELAMHELISLRRVSVAERQKQTLEESLHRLENTYLLASSATDEEAKIRSQEAAMLSDFVKRAREVEMKGLVVVANNDNARKMLLEDGDVIFVPRRTGAVLVSGEVLIAQAHVFKKGDDAEEYINRSGGFTDQADPKKIILVRPSGEVETDSGDVRPGDEILVLPKVPTKNLQLAATLTDIIYKIAVSSAVVMQMY
ncbi:MAG: polysaccharide biosynthesis/export family protein [Deltaproteobacteria bacterium]|nr:polysaccharide biosynthesis/export family protein [Deltaproteobacteria bacterium]